MLNFKNFFALSALALVTTVAAHADSITAGGVINSPTALAFGGTLLNGPVTALNITTSTFSANYDVQVFSDPNNVYCAGCLDFVYQIANIGSTGDVFSLNALSFTGYATNVGYATTNGLINPTQITRSNDGSFLTFIFPGTMGLTPGTYSDFLVIQTNAGRFTDGSVSLQGGLAGNGPGEQPSGPPVPEPSSLILLGTGLLGVARAAKSRFGA